MEITVDTKKLNELMFRKGLSRRALATSARIGYATVIQVCGGKRSPGPVVSKRIVETLECSFDDIFEIVDVAKPNKQPQALMV